jgi:predicted signal transduction protein with EAL and GGDEF domain/DNA-binding response OmpR family regulator
MRTALDWSAGEADRLPRVVLVDDDSINLLLTASALRPRGFEVIEFTHAELALAWLRSNMVDLVVIDARMPGIDGFELCRRLRSVPSLLWVPVLMLTGLDDDESIDQAYEAGATDFLVKSHQWSLLAGRLRHLLRTARTHQELERSRAKLARAQDLARMGSFEWRMATRTLRLEPEAMRVLGHAVRPRARLREVLRLLVERDRQRMFPLLRGVVHHATVLEVDTTVKLPDGRLRVIHVEAEPEFNDVGGLSGYTGVIQDVTDRRLIEDKVLQLANFDALTGLPNRRQLMWRIERALEQSRRLGHAFALLLIDLDRFKIINDTLGHGAGDELLLTFAQRLRDCVQHSDMLLEGGPESHLPHPHQLLEAVGRLGGDEFVALLPEVANEQEAYTVAERMLKALRAPVELSGAEFFVTASVGVAVYPRDGQSVVDLLRNADVAMYSAKAGGRNAAQVYRPHLSGEGRERLELESALHKALERGELVLHYQPKVEVGARRIVGVEALMRWRRGGELVQPADFIGLAEETGLIMPMSEWALREAARQVRQWRDLAGLDLSVAVNLPSIAFERSDLVEHIRQAALMHDVPMHMLELEITETGLMKDLQEVMPALQRLTQSGVSISIDDFGTGYSSLAYLTQLPIGELKIDRSFVRDLGSTEQSSAVVTAIIALARSLGLRVIAEGVETERQREVLHRLGCSTMQGYLFSRPLAPEVLTPWLKQIQRSPRDIDAASSRIGPPEGL